MSDQVTKAEFEIMDVLWTDSPLAAADIAERVARQTSWNLKTVKTLLSRLADKGVIAHQPDGRRYLYRPLLTRAAYAQKATGRLADQLFGGRAAPLVAHLAERGGLSEQDIQDLESLLKELKRDSD